MTMQTLPTMQAEGDSSALSHQFDGRIESVRTEDEAVGLITYVAEDHNVGYVQGVNVVPR
jgi:hypothetical protein